VQQVLGRVGEVDVRVVQARNDRRRTEVHLLGARETVAERGQVPDRADPARVDGERLGLRAALLRNDVGGAEQHRHGLEDHDVSPAMTATRTSGRAYDTHAFTMRSPEQRRAAAGTSTLLQGTGHRTYGAAINTSSPGLERSLVKSSDLGS
jgi:hypothetical protein